MDKPLGPRQPDKRHAAYESIFGRRGPLQNQTTLPPQNYPNYLPPQPASQPYPYSQQFYDPNQDRRTSYSSYAQQPYNQTAFSSSQPHGPPSGYRQQSYPNLPSHLQPNPYNHQQPAGYAYSNSLAPPGSTRARSIISNSSSGIIMSPPSEPQEEVYNQPGLTPAQAYQAQVYQDNPGGSPGDRGKYRGSPVPSDRTHHSLSQNGGSTRSYNPPVLGVTLEQDDGRLGIDFGLNGSNTSDPGTDEGGSELPWARHDQTANADSKFSSQHQRQTSHNESINSSYPLHVDTTTTNLSLRLSIASTSPSSSIADQSFTLVDHTSSLPPRKSSESTRTMPQYGPRRDRNAQDRSMSMSSAPMRAMMEQKKNSRPATTIPSMNEGRDSPVSLRPAKKKTPIVYPALLSRVAQAFRDRIPITDRVKDGLTYKDAFDGREAVDKIAYIIKTTDRNLALLLGRALDAQKFFHDVTYDHRLRDSASELYQFRTKLPSPFVSGELPTVHDTATTVPAPARNDTNRSSGQGSSAEEKEGSSSPSPAPHLRERKDSITSDEAPLPSGVFTLLTDCYSPTCSRDQLCYSIACPRRLEQQARLNMKPQPGLSKQISRESLGDVAVDDGSLWIHSVPQEIVNNVSDAEKKRQEAINEVIYTERDFVRDMEYLRDCWYNRLKEDDVIPFERRSDFLTQVFWNIHDIIAVGTRLRDALNKRQKSYAVVDRIGDVFLDVVPLFRPFVTYGAHQLYGKYEFEKEKNSNPAFAQFVETTERLPESRKLELNAYLTKPTTRLARYPLLLEAVLKHTPLDSPDKTILPKVVSMIREFLAEVNTESGKTENRFNLIQLDQQLVFKPGEEVNLRLHEEGREMVYKGLLQKRDGEIQTYLFDHALLFTKLVKAKQHEHYKVYRRPIPLELLMITASEDTTGTVRSQRKPQALTKKASFSKDRVVSNVVVTVKPDSKGQHWINFMHLGRKYYNLILWASNALSQRKWLEAIAKQQQLMRERSNVFDTVTLNEGFFFGPNKVNCAAPYSGGRRVVYGTDDGVYISDLKNPKAEPVKVLALLEVLQVDVLEEYELLIVLSERQVITFPLEALDPSDPMSGLKRAKRISSHTSFFKAGFCLGRVLVCIVKSSQLSSTFKTLEPIDQNIRGRAKPTFRKLLQGGNDTLKMYKEFYIPVESTSIHYLKTKMCVGCSRGFEIVDLETLETQGLLDPNDESLEFVRRRENLRPMAIYRIHNEFLLCYDEFAFYVNRNGRRSRKDFIVFWEGMPTGFALHEPYVLAFEPSFVEIRHIETGLMSQVIQGMNLRLLFADTPPSVTNYPSVQQQHQFPTGYGDPYGANAHSMGGQIGPHGRSPFSHGPPPYQYPTAQYNRLPQGVGRDEILMVSDDKVISLRMSGRHQIQAQKADKEPR